MGTSLQELVQNTPSLDRKWEYMTPQVEKKVGFQIFGRIVFIKLPIAYDYICFDCKYKSEPTSKYFVEDDIWTCQSCHIENHYEVNPDGSKNFHLLNGRLDYIYNKDNNQLVIYININDSFNLPIDSYENIRDLSETLKKIRQNYRVELPKSDKFTLSFFSSELDLN